MSNEWFARPVLFVADIDRSVDFYVKQLGFTQPWRYEEEWKAWVAQVDRQGCELILSSQWPDKVGKGLMFISLDIGVLDALRAELEGRGVDVKDGQWGYRLMVIADRTATSSTSPIRRHLPPAPSSRRTLSSRAEGRADSHGVLLWLGGAPTARSTLIAGQKQRDDVEYHMSRFDMHDSAMATACCLSNLVPGAFSLAGRERSSKVAKGRVIHWLEPGTGRSGASDRPFGVREDQSAGLSQATRKT